MFVIRASPPFPRRRSRPGKRADESIAGVVQNTLDFIARMDNVSIHAAALKAIEWFNLDPEAMSANEGEKPG